jgi:hypothetical protein
MTRLRVSLLGNDVVGHAVNNDCEPTPRLMRISTQRIQANKDGEKTYMISIYTPPPMMFPLLCLLFHVYDIYFY